MNTYLAKIYLNCEKSGTKNSENLLNIKRK